MTGSLGTTNLLLGIMAAVSVLEGLFVVGLGVAGWMVFRRVTKFIDAFHVEMTRQAAPLAAHVDAILDDVEEVTTTVREEAERMAFMLSNLRQRRRRIINIARGLRRVVHEFLHAA